MELPVSFSSAGNTPKQAFVRALLSNPQAAYRSYLNEDEVEARVTRHFCGKESWPELVAALTVFEIAHRLWIEQIPFTLEEGHPSVKARFLPTVEAQKQ